MSLVADPSRIFLNDAALSLTTYAESHLAIHTILSRTGKRRQSFLLSSTSLQCKHGQVRTLAQRIPLAQLRYLTGKHFPIIIKLSLNLPYSIAKRIASGYLQFRAVRRSNLNLEPSDTLTNLSNVLTGLPTLLRDATERFPMRNSSLNMLLTCCLSPSRLKTTVSLTEKNWLMRQYSLSSQVPIPRHTPLQPRCFIS